MSATQEAEAQRSKQVAELARGAGWWLGRDGACASSAAQGRACCLAGAGGRGWVASRLAHAASIFNGATCSLCTLCSASRLALACALARRLRVLPLLELAPQALAQAACGP